MACCRHYQPKALSSLTAIPSTAKCRRRRKIRPLGGAKVGHFGFGCDVRQEGAARQQRSSSSWRLTGRLGPSGPIRRGFHQAVLVELRVRPCARRQLSRFIPRMLTWWVSLSGNAPVRRPVPKVSVHSSNGQVAGNQGGAAFVALRDHLEQHCGAGPGERDEAQRVDVEEGPWPRWGRASPTTAA